MEPMVSRSFRREPPALFILPSFPPVPKTGGEIYHRKVIDGLIRNGWDVEVAALDNMLSGRSIHDPANRRTASQSLCALLENHEPRNTVVIYDSWLYRFIRPAAWRFRRAFRLVSLSQLCYWDTYRSLHSRLKHRLLTLLALYPADMRIGVSRAVLSADIGRSSSRSRVIYPGCDYAGRELGQADCTRMPAQILSVGNYGPRKGFHVLVSALAEVFVLNPDLRGMITLRCAGNLDFDRSYVQHLRSMVRELSLEDAVIIDSWKDREQLSSLFSQSQLFMLASESEGFGMVVLEAMLHGLPVVINHFMTAEELIGRDGGAGWTVRGNNPQGFTRALLKYFTESDRNAMGRSAQRRARETAQEWDAVCRQFAEVIGGEDGR